MKIRNGFVSNSSSSSFVIITTQEDYNTALEKVAEKYNKNVAKVIERIIGGSSKFSFKGQEGISFYGTIYSESYYDEAYDLCGGENEDEVDSICEDAYEASSDLFAFINELEGFAREE